MKRAYSKSEFSSELPDIIHCKDKNDEVMRLCPCCGSTSSSGEHAQAMYYSLVDDMYKLLTDDSEFRRSRAATKLISRLNQMIDTEVSNGREKSIDGGTAKVKRINQMISKLIEFRK